MVFPDQIARRLVDLAQSGDEDVGAIRDYDLVRRLGQGGMGVVYLLKHSSTGELIALKLMLPGLQVEARAERAFLREIDTTRELKHPNLVELRGSGRGEGTVFLTAEYCEGGDVARLVQDRGRRLPLEEAGRIVLQALEGLEYAHAVELDMVSLADGSTGRGRGLVHRDIKPQNILLSRRCAAGAAKIADFGLAKAFDLAGLSGYTRTGEVSGSAAYMPRQQVINYKYAKPEVDVWAMAAALYFMLTGTSPRNFPAGASAAQRLQNVLTTDAIPIRDRGHAIPDRLAAVIDEALVDTPEIGFRTAAEFKTALEPMFTDEPPRDGKPAIVTT